MGAQHSGRDFSLAGWIPRPAPFNASEHGTRVEFSDQCSVAERVEPEGHWGNAKVYTAQPVPVGEVCRITVLKTICKWPGGLEVGLTTELPKNVVVFDPHAWFYSGKTIHHNRETSDFEDLPSLEHLTPGQSVGLLVTPNGELHLFLNGKHCHEIANGLPVDKSLWGMANIFGKCTKIKSEIMSAPRRGPEVVPSPPRGQQIVEQLQQQLREKEDEIQRQSVKLQQKMREIQQKDAEIERRDVVIQQEEQQLSHIRDQSSQLQQRLNTVYTELRPKNATIQQRDTALQQNRITIQQLQAALQQRDATIQQLREEVREKDAELAVLHSQQRPKVAPQEVEYWQVSCQELQIREDKVLGRGAWGVVCEGLFRGQRVAIKCVHPNILAPHTRDRIRREISTMAQVRHPNLVLFIAAVLEDRSGPKIITEILDTSLRSAYEEHRLGPNRPRIFRDVAAAMNYLHSQREPIVHCDLTTANVLLEAMAGEVWKAKVSDFGSANLVRLATTPGEGAIVYTAPEAFPQLPRSPTPHPTQTTKIDVYSYGVLLCEVMLARFPDSDNFDAMVDQVSRVWPAMHRLITNCIKWNPEERPSMANILSQLDRMNR